jgi:hypothetical protein
LRQDYYSDAFLRTKAASPAAVFDGIIQPQSGSGVEAAAAANTEIVFHLASDGGDSGTSNRNASTHLKTPNHRVFSIECHEPQRHCPLPTAATRRPDASKSAQKKPGRGLDRPRPGHMILWIWQFCRRCIGIVTATPLLTGRSLFLGMFCLGHLAACLTEPRSLSTFSVDDRPP